MSKAHAEVLLDGLFKLAGFEPPHLYGSLPPHLLGTWRILKGWGCDEALQRAGLVHAAYGTEGFPTALLGLWQRLDVAGLVGEAAESLVYLYAACSREGLYGALARREPPIFRDRFTGRRRDQGEETICALCVLTTANEMELIRSDPRHWRRFSRDLGPLFAAPCFRDRLPLAARQDIDRLWSSGL